jgi:hypothetical protein
MNERRPGRQLTKPDLFRNNYGLTCESGGNGVVGQQREVDATSPSPRSDASPAQTAKQVMIQKFREDERAASLLETEFSKHRRASSPAPPSATKAARWSSQIDRAEGFMPRSEQIPGEQFHARRPRALPDPRRPRQSAAR